MKKKFTPGPWKAIHMKNSGFYEITKAINDDDRLMVDLMIQEGFEDEAEANAKIIAAAPDMLEALQNMMLIKNLIQYPNDTKEEHQGEAEAVYSFIQQAELAIKKATE